MLFKSTAFKIRQEFRANTADGLIWQASIALLVLLGICQLLIAFDRSPSSDDAMFLSVPKNWLNGYGWATSYSEKIPFNPDFTGPTALLIPAALLIKLFGNQLWIAGVTGAVINLTLLALCLQQIRAYWKNSGLATFCLVCGCILSQPHDFASTIGYYSGSLLFFLSALIAFNTTLSHTKRAVLIGLSAAIGLHIKWLMAPAFILLISLFLLHSTFQQKNPEKNIVKLLILLLLPIVLLHGSWQLYRQHALSSYSPEFISAYEEYGSEFFRYHGSGIGQWHDAKDKLLYLNRNADKNFYYVEESLIAYGLKNPFLGDAPADENHIVGWLLTASLICAIILMVIRIKRKEADTTTWCFLAFSLTTLVYLGWFVIFSMAMSPGHFYFQAQWLLWTALLAISQSVFLTRNAILPAVTAFLLLCYALAIMEPENRKQIFLFDRTGVIKTDAIEQATAYIKSNTFEVPLAGCGYSGYPRHIEYILPGSQNFSDCLDMIEDHVEFHDGHYRWTSPLSFNLVFSLQSAGTNIASATVINQCKDKALYRNNDVFIVTCEFKDLQKLDLDVLMPEIASTHEWYKTRIRP